jgi:chaperonin GroES
MPAGLIAPVLAEKKKASGVVLAVGAGRRLPSGALVPLDVKPGDTVHFGEYAGIDITQDGEDVVILRECECTLVEPAQ